MKTRTFPSTSSRKEPALHALAFESGPQFLSTPLFSTVMMVGLFASPSRFLLPLAWTLGCFLCGSCGSSATFRGLPAERLGVLPREAASRTFLHGVSIGGLGWPPHEGLSWAAHGISNPWELLLGEIVRGFLPIYGFRQNGIAIAGSTVFLGWVWAGGWPTILAPFWLPFPFFAEVRTPFTPLESGILLVKDLENCPRGRADLSTPVCPS